MMGIDVDRTIAFTFALGGALAGAAGILFVMYFRRTTRTTSASSSVSSRSPRPCWAASAISPGAALGALLIGLIQDFNEGLAWHTPGTDWTQSIDLLDPDPDPRLPAAGPARRAGGGSRMSGAWHELKGSVRRAPPPWVRRYVVPAVFLVLVIFYPRATRQHPAQSANWIAVHPGN